MKATISELFDTGREIISFDNSEFDRPTSIYDLEKCENVLVDKLDKHVHMFPVLIDECMYYVYPNKYNHVGGTMFFLEVEPY